MLKRLEKPGSLKSLSDSLKAKRGRGGVLREDGGHRLCLCSQLLTAVFRCTGEPTKHTRMHAFARCCPQHRQSVEHTARSLNACTGFYW